jgi:hypothetical protein
MLFRNSLSTVLLLSCYVLLLLGCGPVVHLSANKSPDYNEKLTKVYLLIRSAKGASKFADGFKAGFLSEMTKRNIAADSYVIEPLALEGDKDITARIAQYGPQAVVFMNQTESVSTSGGTFSKTNPVTSATFDIKILLPGSDKPVWRGNMVASGNSHVTEAVEKAVTTLIRQMATDGLIGE